MVVPLRRLSHRDQADVRVAGTVVALDGLVEEVRRFHVTVAEKSGRGGQAEAQLRSPVELLIRAIGRCTGVETVPYDEVTLRTLRARPDYAVDVCGTRIGYIELKAPTRGVPPDWHPDERERQQWEKLTALPNLLYTDGLTWCRYSYGQPTGPAVKLGQSFEQQSWDPAPIPDLAGLIQDFLLWEPEQPRSLPQVIRTIAGLCGLLRDEVQAVLGHVDGVGRPGLDLALIAEDWRDLLFPGLRGDEFSDAYAQTVTFALLLARVNGVSFENRTLPEIALLLAKKHLLIGRAFNALVDSDATKELAVLGTLHRVVGAVEWSALDDRQTNAYVELYEKFLAAYDPALRKRSGSYYTPEPVARAMVGFTDTVLTERLGRRTGFADDKVVVIDPAMGTGTFLVEILHRVAQVVDETEGPGARPDRLRELFARRLIGFECQAAPFAIAELRLHQALRTRFATDIPAAEARFLTDALEDPINQQFRMGSAYRVLERSHAEANRIKRDTPVMVVIGNPPHVEHTRPGTAPFIEKRRNAKLLHTDCSDRPSLDEFRLPGNGRYESDLYALQWYFLRWATWKVFDAHPHSPGGVVSFVVPSTFVRSRAFAGMRRYLRRTCDEGWIIDLSPEGHRPRGSTRVFPGVAQPLCVAVFARYGSPDPGRPATIYHRSLSGTRKQKTDALTAVRLDDAEWSLTEQTEDGPFTPASPSHWSNMIGVAEMFPWSSRGVTTGRNWVYAPDVETLKRRWQQLITSPRSEQRRLFVESRDRTVDTNVGPLPNLDPHSGTIADEQGSLPPPVRVARRSFDRQWLIGDNRLFSVARPPLWAVRSHRQVYLTTQNTYAIIRGPALTFTELIPDLHHYNVRSGSVHPLYRDRDTEPNLAPGLLDHILGRLGHRPTAFDVLAYTAGLAAHSGYTRRFREELKQPGVRIPLTADTELWFEAVELGRAVLWLHTFGERGDGGHFACRDLDELRITHGPRLLTPISGTTAAMPETARHDATSNTLHVGAGAVHPVPAEVWQYEITGLHVLRNWLDQRSRKPRFRRRTSRLDYIECTAWTPQHTTELLGLVTVLNKLIELEPLQDDLLKRVLDGPLVGRTELHARGMLPPPQSATKPPPGTDPSQTILLR